jgi:hypothetical protein
LATPLTTFTSLAIGTGAALLTGSARVDTLMAEAMAR